MEAQGEAPFEQLPPEVQEAVRAKQRARKAARDRRRQQQQEEAQPPRPAPAAPPSPAAAAAHGAGPPPPGEAVLGGFPTQITSQEYFAACPFSAFPTRGLRADEQSVAVVMMLVLAPNAVEIAEVNGRPVTVAEFNYFRFPGAERADEWAPRLYVRLAYEGFFTITSGTSPLPELQPHYSVVGWPQFHASGHVTKSLRRLRAARPPLWIQSSPQPVDVWEAIEAYQQRHGRNWLTRRYLETMRQADADPALNFRLHAIELRARLAPPAAGADGDGGDDPSGWTLVAGELGYSIGTVYTSLTGFNRRVAAEELGTGGVGTGTAQLVLLGLWLERHGYAFWSLGHCYSPEMDYKRQLGHRVVPRLDFLRLLAKHRGAFEEYDASGEGCACGLGGASFAPLPIGAGVALSDLLGE